MFLYKENMEKVRYQVTKDNIIGKGLYGSVHRLSTDECVKIYSKVNRREIDTEILKLIKRLSLSNFCEIHEILYSRETTFKGYTMKYYPFEELDILTTSSEYTIHNLQNLLTSIKSLTRENIYIHDMHDENVIVNSDDITVIDVDLYTFNNIYNKKMLKYKNISALKNLFSTLYIESLKKYHPEIFDYTIAQEVKNIFQLFTYAEKESTCKMLTRHKYPIDYIKKQMVK